MESAIFFRNRKVDVVEFVRVSELYLVFTTSDICGTENPIGKVVVTSF